MQILHNPEMDIREQLLLAAKATGKDIDPENYDEEDGFAVKYSSHWWNPRQNVKQAMQIAAILRINITWHLDGDHQKVTASLNINNIACSNTQTVPDHDVGVLSLCRAIVMTAAEYEKA